MHQNTTVLLSYEILNRLEIHIASVSSERKVGYADNSNKIGRSSTNKCTIIDFLVEMLRFRGHVGALYIHAHDAQQDDRASRL